MARDVPSLVLPASGSENALGSVYSFVRIGSRSPLPGGVEVAAPSLICPSERASAAVWRSSHPHLRLHHLRPVAGGAGAVDCLGVGQCRRGERCALPPSWCGDVYGVGNGRVGDAMVLEICVQLVSCHRGEPVGCLVVPVVDDFFVPCQLVDDVLVPDCPVGDGRSSRCDGSGSVTTRRACRHGGTEAARIDDPLPPSLPHRGLRRSALAPSPSASRAER